MNNLLIYATASGRYEAYEPLFRFCIEKAYPRMAVEVERLPYDKRRPYYSSCYRFLKIPELKIYHCYNYVYITDIDMLICPESPSLLTFHTLEMEKTGLPYSNVPRWKEPMGENRLTGLHFIEERWYTRTFEAREKELYNLKNGLIGSCKCDDELMLMRIVKASGLDIPERGNLLRRHHGIHLGTLRDYRDKTLQQRRNNVRTRIRPHAGYWCNLIETADYKAIVRTIRDKDLLWELKELEKFARQIAGVK